MKKATTLFIAVFCIAKLFAQSSVCDSTGNIVIFSNYDGGVLNINVDQNIPNLKIGVCTYEPVTINIGGTYAANVTAVVYAGYVATNNNHCSNSPTTTTVIGVAANITAVNFLPPVTLSNPNGYTSIVCNYSCSTTTNQGGCNTPDQIVSYFVLTMGGTFRSHYTQYGCWSTTPYAVSAGGNCCITPFPLDVKNPTFFDFTKVYSDNSTNEIRITGKLAFPSELSIEIVNVFGQVIYTKQEGVVVGLDESISTFGMATGIYFVRMKAGMFTTTHKIAIQN